MSVAGRVVLDCNVVLQAAAKDASAAYACLKLIGGGAGELVWSDAVLNEYRDVLYRPSVRRKLPHLTRFAAEDVLAYIQERGVRVDPVPHVVIFDRDPADEPYLDLAVAAKAALLVSRDNDLLQLAQSPLPPELALLQSLSILDPVEFLQRYRAKCQS